MPRHVQTTGQPTAAGQAPISQGSGEGAMVWTGVVVNPMTTLGDLMYGGASGAVTRLAGDTSNTRKFLRELSSGGVAAAPAWDTLVAADIPNIAESQVTNLTTDLAAKASLASPTFTGTPAAPTATGGTNTTQLATTAFVQSAISTLATDSLVMHLAGTETATGAKTFTGGVEAKVSGALSTVPLTVTIDSSIATQTALIIRNLTNFANTGNWVEVDMSNASDTGKGLVISNKGSGKSISLTDGTTEHFYVTKNGQVVLGPSTTALASLNIPSGTAPTTPAAGDLYYDGTHLYFYSGSAHDLLAGGSGMTNPMTTLGDIIYGGTGGSATRLAGNTTSGLQFLVQTGTGTVSAAPVWHTLAAGDVPTLNQNTTGSAATLTTARSIQTNLASTSSANFDGSANITPGVTGTLPTSNGGTGNTTGTAAAVALPGSLAAGGSQGMTLTLTSAQTQAIGDLCTIDSTGKATLAKADVIADASAILIATAAVTGSASNTYMVVGILRLSSSPAWTKGGLIYLSTTGTTGNTLTQTAPSATNNVIQVVGIALGVDIILFNPSLMQVEHA